MPRFFTHLHTPSRIIRDTSGGDYENLEAAHLDVLHAVRDVIADYAHEGEMTDGFLYEIADADEQTLMVVPFDNRRL